MESDGDHFLAYYLTEDDDTALQFKVGRAELPVNAASEEEVCSQSTCFYGMFLNPPSPRLHSISSEITK